MKIYKKIVIDFNGNIIEEDSYEYSGKVAECLLGGRGGGTSTATSAPPEWMRPYMERIGQGIGGKWVPNGGTSGSTPGGGYDNSVWGEPGPTMDYGAGNGEPGPTMDYGAGNGSWQGGLLDQPLKWYPGKRTAGFTPEQTAAQNWGTKRAVEGSAYNNLAGGQFADIMSGKYLNEKPDTSTLDATLAGRKPDTSMFTAAASGDYLDPEKNPFLQSKFNNLLQKTLPGLSTSSRSAGMSGSSADSLLTGQAMGELGAQIYEPERQRQAAAQAAISGLLDSERGRQYGAETGIAELLARTRENERGRQFGAMQFAPTMANEEYKDIGVLAGIGEEKQAMEQQGLNEMLQAFEFSQMEPWQRYGMASNIFSGMPAGGINTTTTNTRGK